MLVDVGPESAARARCSTALGDDVPRALLLTHIHFDHAGAAGALVRRWPDLEVWVHERGAPHLVDPERLVASARRLYGDDFDRLWGEVVPIPEGNLRVLSGGETIGDWRVAYTPGHASHHVAYLDQRTGAAFVGDVAGARIGNGPMVPPTPPPDIDLELWAQSIDTIAAWEPDGAGDHALRDVHRRRRAARLAAPRAAPLGAARARADRRATTRPRSARPGRGTPSRPAYDAVRPGTRHCGQGSTATGRSGYPQGHESDDRASPNAGARFRAGRGMARDRSQRRSQHVRACRRDAGAHHSGRHGRPSASRSPTASTTPVWRSCGAGTRSWPSTTGRCSGTRG